MRYLVGIIVAIIVKLILMALNTYLLKYPIPEFLMGWFTCTAYFYTAYYNDTIKQFNK